MPRRPGTSSSDFSFGLFVATCTAGALGLLLLGASAAAFLEAGGGADPAASAGFWLSLAGNAICGSDEGLIPYRYPGPASHQNERPRRSSDGAGSAGGGGGGGGPPWSPEYHGRYPN